MAGWRSSGDNGSAGPVGLGMILIGLVGCGICALAGGFAYLMSTDLVDGNKLPPELAPMLFGLSGFFFILMVAGVVLIMVGAIRRHRS